MFDLFTCPLFDLNGCPTALQKLWWYSFVGFCICTAGKTILCCIVNNYMTQCLFITASWLKCSLFTWMAAKPMHNNNRSAGGGRLLVRLQMCMHRQSERREHQVKQKGLFLLEEEGNRSRQASFYGINDGLSLASLQKQWRLLAANIKLWEEWSFNMFCFVFSLYMNYFHP